MPKVSVVALLAAGPILCATTMALAQTQGKSPNPSPSASATTDSAASEPAPAATPKAAAKKAGNKKKAKAEGDKAATDSPASAPTAATSTSGGTTATDPSAPAPDGSTSNVAADVSATDSSDVERSQDVAPSRGSLPAATRAGAEPTASPTIGPLLPTGLAPSAEPAPSAAVSSAQKSDEQADAVLAEDWWSHARPILELHGYFRTRAEMFHNFSLGRVSNPSQALWAMPADNRYYTGDAYNSSTFGPSLCTPGESDEVPGDSSAAADAKYACKNKNNSSANLRFRINPELHVSDNLRIVSQIDVLDNLVLGSTPSGYANEPTASGYKVIQRSGYTPLSFFDNTTEPPSAGINSYKDSIRVKRVWGEYSTPVGQLRFGRMPDHFGLGMYHNSGDGYDDDYQSTIDRIMFVSTIKPLELYVAGAWDFPNSGATSESLQNPQAQPFNVSNLVNVRQFSLMLMRQKSPQLQKLSLSRGDLVINAGAYLQYRWQDLAADYAGNCSSTGTTGTSTTVSSGAALGCPSWGVSQALVRRGARAFTPDLWMQVLYKKFRFELEAVTVQGTIDNVSSSTYEYTNSAAGGSWKLQSYGIASEIQQRLLEDRLDLSFNWGWASGDSNAAQLDGSMGLQPGNNGLQNSEGANRISTFRFNPAYRIDLILNRNILSRVQGTYYFRPAIGYDFMRKTNGQRLGGNLAGIWTRASEYVQAPGHQRDLGIEVDASIYFQSKDGVLNDKPGSMGGFFTMLQWGMLFPMGGLGYPSDTNSKISASGFSTDLSNAQILRWYMGIFY